MNTFFDEDNKVIFNNLMLGNFIILLLIGLSIVITLKLSTALAIILAVTFVIIGYIILLVFLKRGIKKLNDKYIFTDHVIRKRNLIIASIITETFLLIIMLIPLLGQILSLYLMPIIIDNFVIRTIRNGKVTLDFSKLRFSYKKHHKFSMKYLLLNFASMLASIGILSAGLFAGNLVMGMNFGVIFITLIFALVVITMLAIDSYIKAVLYTHLLKNLSDNEDKELIKAEEY